MAGNIKGITIDINGDTTKLDRALSDVDKSTKNVNGELKQVNSLLKFNPGNTDLIAQKQQLLAKQVQNTSERLKTLKDAQAQVEAQFKSGDLGEEEYRAFQREVVATESKLKNYEGQIEKSKSSQAELESSTKRLGTYFQASEKSVDDYADVLGPKLTAAIKSGSASSDQLNEAINKIGRTVTNNEQDFDQFNAALKRVDDGGSIDELQGELTQLSAKSKQADDALGQIGGNTMSERLQNIGDGLADAGEKIQELAGKAVDAWGEMDDAVDNLTSKTGAVGPMADSLAESYEKVESSMAGAQMESGDLSNTMALLHSQFGLSGDALEQTTEYVAKFSQVTGQSSTEAVDALHTAMAQFNVSAKDLPAVLDSFTAASQRTGVPVADLEQQVSRAYPAFKQLGISLTDGIPMLAAWSKSGIDSNTVLKGMQKAFVATKDSAGGFKQGITDAFNGIKNAKTDQDAFNIAIQTFGAKSGPQMAQAIRDNKVSLDDLTKSAGNTGGTVKKTFDQTLDPIDKVHQSQKKLNQSLGELGGTILETVAPALQSFVGFLKVVVSAFSNLPGPVKVIIVALGGLVAALGMMAPIITAVASVLPLLGVGAGASAVGFGALSASILPVVAVIAGIVAVIAIVILAFQHWGDIVNWFKGLWNGISSFFSGLWTGIQQVFTSAITAIAAFLQPAFSAIVTTIQTIWNGVSAFFGMVWNAIKTVFTVALTAIAVVIGTIINGWINIITTVMNAIKAVFTVVWNGIKAFIGPILSAIGNVISTAWNGIKAGTSAVFNAIKSVITSVWNAIKAFITPVVNAIKSVVTSAWNGIKSVTSSVFNGIKLVASSVWNGIKSTISGVVNSIKSTVSGVWNGIKSVTSSVWNGIKSAIEKPMNAAKSIVSGIINAIKGFFHFSISWPHIPMPSFGISPAGWKIGDLLKGSIPHLSVSWHAAGGVFNKPTLFAGQGGQLHGVGEAGPEGVLPLNDKTFAAIGKGIADNMDGGGVTVNATIYGAITDGVARQWAEKLAVAINDAQKRKSLPGGGIG
ncbi:phage tail tape measure protein [Lacticaseibacillus brantae]|uniref:Phage tail tape measure protein domain-containing protein n=1 Tax=Lacticaseibacillus brantae DSM 23927 TaxID=1423727 RepID=A0A0R2B0F5_9LACO|nr:phage tail tape measure protein [Lacticaseibacillus brantae]KRM73005.1 hypothetical protein FC34_GL000724 [Lacticaseibacillus brantae DSM 23927]